MYEGFWHSLTAGELEENIDQVFSDIFTWCVTHNVGVIAQPSLNEPTTTSRTLHVCRLDRQLAKPTMTSVLTPSSLRGKGDGEKKGIRQRLRL